MVIQTNILLFPIVLTTCTRLKHNSGEDLLNTYSNFLTLNMSKKKAKNIKNDYTNDSENKFKNSSNDRLSMISDSESSSSDDIEFPLKVLGDTNYFRNENEDDISSSDDEMYSTLRHKKSKRRNTLNLNIHITDDDLSDISLENNSSINNDSVVTKKLKKKKKYNKSLNSIPLNTDNDIEIKSIENTYEEDEPNINDSNFREQINQNINLSSDTSSENNSRINNDNIVTKKFKKKKKHNKNFSSIELNTNNDIEIKSVEKTYKEDEQKINDSSFRGNMSEKINLSSDISLENNSSINNDSVVIKKKKKHNKSLNSIELNTNNDIEIKSVEKTYKEDEQKINDSSFRGNMREKINLSSDTSLENNSSIINDSVVTTNRKPNIINSGNNISQKRKYKINTLGDIDNVPKKKLKNKNNNDNSLNSFEFNTINDSEISQNHFKLKNLLNSMESNDFEGASTKIETKFNLIKYLKYKEASLQNHPKFKQIMQMLSKKIKDIVNKNCQITNADIVLLKTVGNIILEKIVEKMNAAQDINDIIITLPPECKENKIHFIETALGRPPSKEKMKIIKKLNPHVKLRVFNIEEDNLIREYWSKFQKEYKISNILPFLSNGLEMVLNNTQKLQFVRYISAGLPNRLLSSVFNRFNVLFNGNQDKTRFSEEEDQLIMKVEKCDVIKRKLSVLSLILNRSRMQLYRRHGVLKNQFEKCKKVCWDDQKRQELFTNILLETNTDNWKDLKNLTLKKNILIKIAENLGEDVTFEKVRKQWNYLYTMLFCEKPIKMLSLRLKILKLLEQQNFKHFSDVNWIKITNQLYPGANSKLICDVFHSWIDKNVPSNLKKNIKDTLNYLREHNVDKIRKTIHKHGEREFPRLTVQDYDLLVVIDE